MISLLFFPSDPTIRYAESPGFIGMPHSRHLEPFHTCMVVNVHLPVIKTLKFLSVSCTLSVTVICIVSLLVASFVGTDQADRDAKKIGGHSYQYEYGRM